MSRNSTQATLCILPILALWPILFALPLGAADNPCPGGQPFAGLDGQGYCGATESVALPGQSSVAVDVWKGIGFGSSVAPPNRWKKAGLAPWPTGTVPATEFGPICPQMLGASCSGNSIPDRGLVEDCLFLNVWAPEAGDGLPVMVFVHGGAFITGSGGPTTADGSEFLYDGSYLAAVGEVVVVTLNYRLGALGFVYATDEVGNALMPANLGLTDQLLALQWVAQYIHEFGGDPSRVTIFGESAGAMSVGMHLFSIPESQAFFDGAIMESNPMNVIYKQEEAASNFGKGYFSQLCKLDAACLSELAARLQLFSTSDILCAQDEFARIDEVLDIGDHGLAGALPFAPIVDGVLVTDQPNQGFSSAVKKSFESSDSPPPFLFGVNEDEGALFADMVSIADEKFGPGDYHLFLDQVFTDASVGTIYDFSLGVSPGPYNPAQSTNANEGYDNGSIAALSNVITDYVFRCGNLSAARAASDVTGARMWGYTFTQPPFFNLYEVDSEPPPACNQESGHVCHGNELPYVFHTLDAVPNVEVVPTVDDDLSLRMAEAWTCFAQAPEDAANCAPWSVANGTNVVVLNSDDDEGWTTTDLAQDGNCQDLWSKIELR